MIKITKLLDYKTVKNIKKPIKNIRNDKNVKQKIG